MQADHEHGANGSAGRAPQLSGSGPDPLTWDDREPRGKNKGLLIVAGLALIVATGGMVRSMCTSKSGPASAAAAQPSIYGEQVRMAREAMNMAREAQAMQRERMEMMRQEMERADGPYGGEEPIGDAGSR